MTRENYRNKLGTLLLTRQALEDKLEEIDKFRLNEFEQGIYTGPALLLYNSLYEEWYSLLVKVGKLEDKYHKDGFTANQWCEDYNYFIDLYRMEETK